MDRNFILIALIIGREGRSREGAWIEIAGALTTTYRTNVAPARERGLKSWLVTLKILGGCRSREGAWIEILSS